MAKTLDSFNFGTRTNSTDYPWDDWTDGRVWELTRGVDFTSNAASFRAHLYKVSKDRGIDVRSRIIDEDTIVFRFNPQHNGESPNGSSN